MICDVNVTFEYLINPPETHRVEKVKTVNPWTAVMRGVKEAKKVLKPKRWTSIVVVVERLDEEEEE